MTCPVEIALPILQIIRIGLLNIRSFGWSGKASRCAAEADHLHNLPQLLESYSRQSLDYYLDVEQPIFVKEASGEGIDEFHVHWDALRAIRVSMER
jgi:hypothetical protein